MREKSVLQHGFSEAHPDAVFNEGTRGKKARKVLAILKDHCGALDGLAALEIGCAAGYGSVVYAAAFGRVVSADIDAPAVIYGARRNPADNLDYVVLNGEHLPFNDQCFDVVVCSHVYEHVPSARDLMAEIGRVLKPNGVCFFAAGNRFQLIEPHYRLPLLSVIPKRAAHWYLRLANRGRYYYENHRSYWGLRRLVAAFRCIDYTVAAVDDPVRYQADDIVRPDTFKQAVARLALRWFYWLCPTYLWLLVKR